MSRVVTLALVGALLGALSGCRETARELGSGPAGPPAADAFVASVATRFGPVEREPAFDVLRPKLAGAALVPSRVFDEPTLWTAAEGDWRQLEFFGEREADRYRLGVRPSAPPPSKAGDYRGRLRLRRIEDGRFEWVVREELAVGPMRPQDTARALTAFFQAAEGVTGDEARARARAAFPRTSAAFSRLVQLETFELAPEAGGATAIRLGLRLRPEGLRDTAPRYAAYLERYATPMQLTVVASDETGARWWTLDAAERLWTLRLKVRGGSLVPLDGAADRRLPDRLRVTLDYSTKFGIFSVGVRDLVADVSLTRTEREKALVARFHETPDWRLPFLIEPFIRGSLRYPFEDPGSELGYALRERTDGATRLVRDYRARVRESWIVRWLGGMTNQAVSEFRKGAEAESDRFSRECLYALRDDVVTLLNEPG